jgi:GNAT superfamily N-acetyltransferase
VNGYRIAALDPALDTRSFRCGHPALDAYIQQYAGQDARRNIARVFAATADYTPSHLAGFYTLSAGSVQCELLPPALAKKLPRYPVPVALVGRLAVDQDHQGQGLGSILLADACQRVVQAGRVLAVVGIVVDAKDERAALFYSHFGFIPLPGQPTRLLLPLNRIR